MGRLKKVCVLRGHITIYSMGLLRVQLIATITSFTLISGSSSVDKMKLLSIIILALSVAYASGFRCYESNGDSFSEENTCEPGVGINLLLNACVKFYTKDYTTRGCGLVNTEVDCGKKEGICTCQSDLCNSAISFNPTTGVIIALIGGFISRFL